jgi:hypothetical protein
MLRRHAPDVVSLVFGILFAGFAAIWLLYETDVVDSHSAWFAGPAILIVAGVLGLLVALRPSRSEAPQPAPWTPPAPVDQRVQTVYVDGVATPTADHAAHTAADGADFPDADVAAVADSPDNADVAEVADVADVADVEPTIDIDAEPTTEISSDPDRGPG